MASDLTSSALSSAVSATPADATMLGSDALVTGATGLVGRHLVACLLRQGYSVTVLARDVARAAAINQLRGARFVAFDLSSQSHGFDVPKHSILFHCAWENVRDTLSLRHIDEHAINNYRFIKGLVEQGVKRVLVTGTCFEYGLQYGAISANQATQPNTPYALAKDYLHKSLRLLQAQTDFELIWARLFYLYGEGQDSRTVISLFDQALEDGAKSFNMSFGEQLFDYLPVEQVAEQLACLPKRRNGTFNVCSGAPISLRRLLEQRMREKGKTITLNLGHYSYRKQDSIAIWGADPVADRAHHSTTWEMRE